MSVGVHVCLLESMLLTICLQLARLTVSAASLINGLDNEDVLSATL